MDATEKVALIGNVTRELNRRYKLTELKAFLAHFGIKTPQRLKSNSIPTYIRKRLIGISDIMLIEMAKQLGIDTKNLTIEPAKQEAISPTKSAIPKSKNDTPLIKAFISHSTIDAIYANAIKENFKQYGIEAFVSGTDIKGGQRWRKKIRKEINEMKIFIAIHTQAFSESLWCQQETGLALARENDIEIIPINYNKRKTPKSFLDDFQYIEGKTKTTETVVREIFETLKESEKIKDLYFAKIADKVAQKPIEQIENIYSIRSKEVTKKGLAVYKAST